MLTLKSGLTIRHVSSLDVDMYITKVVFNSPNFIKVKVLYFNRTYNNTLLFIKPEVIKIKREDLHKWQVV